MMISAVWPTGRARGAAAVLAAAALGLFYFVVVRQAEWAGLVAERVAKGKKPRLEDYVFEGQWHAAVVTAGLCLVLALTARYWMPCRVEMAAEPAVRKAWRGPVGFWAVLLVVVAGAAWLRAPRMTLSLYNDEEYAFRRYVAGEHKPLPDGTREWRPVNWLATLWGNQMGNNGVPYSLLSRASYDWAVANGRAEATLPAEVPLRMPALLAGLGSIVVIALLARHLGGPVAGLAAAVLAALHPWHVRYSTEARGHSLVLLLAPLLPLALARAVDSGRWRWWALFGATEVGLLWSFAGSLYYVVAFNFLALVWLWRRGGGTWRTFLAVHVMAAIVYLHLMAPCFPQIRAALAGNDVFSSGLSRHWFANTGSFLLAGMPWENANPEIASHPSLGGASRVVTGFVLVWMLLALAAGSRRAWDTPAGRLLVPTLPLAAALAVTATLVGKSVLFSWYVLYLLPGGLVLAGVGLVAIMRRGKPRRGGLAIALSVAPVVIAFFAWITLITGPLVTYRKLGKQALRDVARFLRTPIEGVAPLAVLHASEAGAYDPTLEFIDPDPARLKALMARADAERRPLLVAFGYRPGVAMASPDFLHAIEESGDFERVAHFPGLEEPQFAHHVWRYRPR
jgi:hypothetical protein